MPRDFYPMVEEQPGQGDGEGVLTAHPARIAVYDDAAAAPRVVVIEPKGVREFLEEITGTVNKLSHEQGGTIPFMVIREIVENFVHAYFLSPTITILDMGNTIRFSDQGPGIQEKDLALEYGTSSATEEMRKYIRGVGSGLPYAQQYMEDKGGSLTIEDNIQGGTVVTISVRPKAEARGISRGPAREEAAHPQAAGPAQAGLGYPAQTGVAAMQPQAGGAAQMGWGQGWQQASPQPWQQPAQGWPQQAGQPWQQAPYQQQALYQQPAPYQQQPMPQGTAQQPFYPQQMPQQGGAPAYAQQAGAPVQQAFPQQPGDMHAPAPGAAGPALSERGRMAIDYLAANGSCGPTDLAAALGYSGPTWSRELASLAAAGYVTKRGQKHYLTAVGTQLAQ